MCNAWNHPKGCSCGWGGGNFSGSRSQHENNSYSWIAPILNSHESYVNPNACCPVCGAAVFFYLAPNGGRVFFDELGPPWPKHPCTDQSSIPYPARNLTPQKGFKYKWQKKKWSPFIISSLFNVDRATLKVTGELKGKEIELYIVMPLTSHNQTSAISSKCIAQIRELREGVFKLSLITHEGQPYERNAFSRLTEARDAHRVLGKR